MAISILQTQSRGNLYLTAYCHENICREYFYVGCNLEDGLNGKLNIYGECGITAEGAYIPTTTFKTNEPNLIFKDLNVFYPQRSMHILKAIDYNGQVQDYCIGGGKVSSLQENQNTMMESQRWFHYRIVNSIKHLCKDSGHPDAYLAATMMYNNANELRLSKSNDVVLMFLGKQFRTFAEHSCYYCSIPYELYLKLNVLIKLI